MSELISDVRRLCPFCAEPITIVVDFSAGSQVYIEDCEVCCQPMEVTVATNAGGDRSVQVARAS
jgi:hypothetical protein